MYLSTILVLHTAPVIRKNRGSALRAGQLATREKTYLNMLLAHFKLKKEIWHTQIGQAKSITVVPIKVDQQRQEQEASS